MPITPEQAKQELRKRAAVKELERRSSLVPQQAQPVSRGDGLASRIGGDIQSRLGTQREILEAKGRGEIGAIRSGLQQAGQAAGGILDVGGEVIEEGVRALPDPAEQFVRKSVQDVASFFSNLPSNVASEPTIGEFLGNRIAELRESNPNAARDVEAALNIGALIAPVKTPKPKPTGVIRGKISEPIGKAGDAVQQASIKLSSKAPDVIKKSPIPNADDLRKTAGKLYDKADQKGGSLSVDFTDDFIKQSEEILLDIDPKVRGLKTNKPLLDVFDDIEAFKDEGMTLQRAQAIDEFLGDAIDGFTEFGRVKKQGKKVLDVQSNFRKMIEEAAETSVVGGKEGFRSLVEARGVWSTSRKLDDVERIITRAELMDSPAQGIKSGFRTLLNNPNRIKGFNKVERAAIKNAAETGVIVDTLRVVGSRLNPIIALSSGGGLGAAAASQATSLATRGAATRVQVNKAKKLAELIARQGAVKETTAQAIGRRANNIVSDTVKGSSKATKELGGLLKATEKAIKQETDKKIIKQLRADRIFIIEMLKGDATQEQGDLSNLKENKQTLKDLRGN